MEKGTILNKLHFILFMVLTVALSAIITVVIYFFIALAGMKGQRILNVSSIAKELKKTHDSYTLSKEAMETLEQNHCFAFLMNEDGNVIWEYEKPKDIPDKFSLQEVASFSRWYLKDYPVLNWKYGSGIFVVGYPKNTLWKYTVEMPNTQIELLIKWMFPMMLLIMACIFTVGALWNKRILKNQDKERTEWIAGVSHDIRTPLTMILGYAKELSESKTNTSEQKEQAQIILRQSKRIKVLVEDFNMANKLTYGMLSIDKKKVKLSAVLRQVVADIMNAGLNECYEIDLDVSEDCIAKVDEKLLYRAVMNLVRNSIYHNPSGCHIKVSCQKTTWGSLLRVQDDGCGYEKAIRKRRRVISKKLNNHGLGLVIVNKIMKAHHGTLKLYNNGGAVAELRFFRLWKKHIAK